MSGQEIIQLKKAAFCRYFDNLNTPQREAAFQINGPVLLLAGAGSGKTTAMIHRIMQMVQFGNGYHQADEVLSSEDAKFLEHYIGEKAIENSTEVTMRLREILAVEPVKPWQILAITFTNKAANELKTRLISSLGEETAFAIHASTFHSACSKMLRRSIEKLGFSSNFTIYDADDSQRLMKACIAEADVPEKQFPPKTVLNEISLAKDRMCSPEKMYEESNGDYRKVVISKLYKEYQLRLKAANALDFDDIIYKTVELLENDPEELAFYQNRFRYIMVDEYQDTNHAQFRFIQLLSQSHQNLCVVGDDDQSIYRFRGATIENILSFEEQFQNTVVIRLEQNYRSTKTILTAANQVIAHNIGRKEKKLWTTLPQGDQIVWYKAADEMDEARFVAESIEKKVKNGASYQDFAVLYRMNAQSNNIERELVKRQLPYRIYGGTRFYDRKEVKDILAYMSILCNPFDMVRFKRIVNEPKRGIGDATLELLENITMDLGTSPVDVMQDVEEYPVLAKKVNVLKKFAGMIRHLQELAEALPLDVFFESLLEFTGYTEYLQSMGEEGKNRLENVAELKSNVLKYMQEAEAPTLQGFLEEISLYADSEQIQNTPETVSLMTIHSAKGLEFKEIFLVGMEENIFPSARSINSLNMEDLEEERRLAYVAITRAKERLCITTAGRRMMFGMTTTNSKSRFFNEIDMQLIQTVKNKNTKDSSELESKVGTVQSISLQQQLANKKQKDMAFQNVKVEYRAGERVHHKIFGDGTILSIQNMGNDAMLEIGFDKVGTKKIMANFARTKMQVLS